MVQGGHNSRFGGQASARLLQQQRRDDSPAQANGFGGQARYRPRYPSYTAGNPQNLGLHAPISTGVESYSEHCRNARYRRNRSSSRHSALITDGPGYASGYAMDSGYRNRGQLSQYPVDSVGRAARYSSQQRAQAYGYNAANSYSMSESSYSRRYSF